MKPTATDISQLPGEELIGAGLADISAGHLTVPACLVWIGAPRLRRHGLLSKEAVAPLEPERLLYSLLRAEGPEAYGRYNAFLRTLGSFERALDHRRARAGRG